MESKIEIISNKHKKIKKENLNLEFFNKKEIKNSSKFHESIVGYEKTPLISLDNLAKKLSLDKIWVKDESKRFGLNAFKVLGGAYCIAKYISEELGYERVLSYEELLSKEIKEKTGELTFVTATDGNHGRGVAWSANKMGHKSVVYMPKGSAKSRLDNIIKEGAHAEITDFNYDDAVRYANEMAEKNEWIMVQDTAWEGYEKIPTWISQGYATIIKEIEEEIQQKGENMFTHVILQAGVGSFAGAITGYLASNYKENMPLITVVEPENAACIFESGKSDNGKPKYVKGDLKTIMAGLACGEPNTITWEILKDYSSYFIKCKDELAAYGMRILSNSIGNDKRIISGESGAIGIGVLTYIIDNNIADVISKLNLNSNSRVLVISTEGDTDPIEYRNIVWKGKYYL